MTIWADEIPLSAETLAKLRERVNPADAAVRGTESHERAALLDHIEHLEAERKRLWDAWDKAEGDAIKAKSSAAKANKRLEAIRALVTTEHESLSSFVSRVRSCLYMENF